MQKSFPSAHSTGLSISLSIALGLPLAGCSQDDATPMVKPKTAVAPLVETVIAQMKPVARSIESVGTLYGDESVVLTAKVTEQVSQVFFEGGELVQQGQVLAELKKSEQQALLTEAEATLREAELQRDRLLSLGKEIATAAQIDVAQAKVDASKAQVSALKSRIDDRTIQAPFAGVVGFRKISVGAMLSPGTVIAELDAIDPLKLDFTLPEMFISRVKAGDSIVGTNVAWPGKHFTGEIQRIGTRVDPVSRAFPVRALIANAESELRPGMLMNVKMSIAEPPGITLPENVLIQVGDHSAVFVVNGEHVAERRNVELGQRLPGAVVLLSGVEAGERVVTKGQAQLRPGVSVRDHSGTVKAEG